jgi:hypothetical protein
MLIQQSVHLCFYLSPVLFFFPFSHSLSRHSPSIVLHRLLITWTKRLNMMVRLQCILQVSCLTKWSFLFLSFLIKRAQGFEEVCKTCILQLKFKEPRVDEFIFLSPVPVHSWSFHLSLTVTSLLI